MKLNPFRKKTSGYYDAIKAKFDDSHRELDATQNELAKARAEYDKENASYKQIRDAASCYALSNTEKQSRQHKVVSECFNRVNQLESDVSQIQSRLQPLRRILEAPQRYDETQATLVRLVEQRRSLVAEHDKTDALIAKVEKRLVDAEARMAAETNAASRQMIATEGDFVVPESLTRLEVELRLTHASMVNLQQQRDEVVAHIKELPAQIKDAERDFIHARAVIAEIDLHEQLMPVMNLFARAAATRHQNSRRHEDEYKFNIDIPHELLESARSELAAEVPSA
jgi:multidrug efflux pump subunit AcrA (membrane-fusion protein)